MQRAAIHLPSNSADRGTIPEFNVVIAYEDFNAGKQAKAAYDFLVANLTHEWSISRQMWKFEVLGIPELRNMAAKEAARANLIIVSSCGDRDLPVEVKAWIEAWLGYQGNSVALVALFDCPPEGAERTQVAQAYLEGVAKRGRMEFFTWPELWPERAGLRGGALLDRCWDMTGEALVPLATVGAREESSVH
jgi:hypothetical protein